MSKKQTEIDKELYDEDWLGQHQAPNVGGVLGDRFIVPPFSVLDARQWSVRKRRWRQRCGLRGEEGRQEEKNEPEKAGTAVGVTFSKNLDGHGSKMRDEYLEKEEEKEFEKFTEDFSEDRKKDIKESKDRTKYKKFTRLKQAYNLQDKDYMRKREGSRKAAPNAYNAVCGEYRNNDKEINTGTSIFDPCLCELMYRWFCVPGGSILDPFAGGSTRGIVAEVLGYNYTGIEIRPNQVEANIEQAEKIDVHPNWLVGDSFDVKKLVGDNEYDMVFTCPPYYDLEVYSIDSRDGSTHETYEEFLNWYYKLFRRVVKHLKDNRFLVVVVGEIRDKKTGAYRNFVGDTIQTFLELGLTYYNELILVTTGGSLPLRVGRQFEVARKIGKSHQNILVFYKGDMEKIRDVFVSDDYIKISSVATRRATYGPD